MSILLALVRKDLLLFLRNRRAVLMTVAAPILIAAFFGSLFGANARVSQLPIGVADEDGSPLSRQIVDALRADTTIALRELPAAQAEEEVRAGRLRDRGQLRPLAVHRAAIGARPAGPARDAARDAVRVRRRPGAAEPPARRHRARRQRRRAAARRPAGDVRSRPRSRCARPPRSDGPRRSSGRPRATTATPTPSPAWACSSS
ncbi:ABC transporter permease [Piscinibacter sakaiensis]|uniref:ABC transporter permease n=1 Tax=Piscinibacter sakaiensis TaxID=1547922 RepID=UPI00372CD920